MGYYKVVLSIGRNTAPQYMGVYRYEPEGQPLENKEYMQLFYRYVDYMAGPNMGITTELSAKELFRFADLASVYKRRKYDVIYFSGEKACPHKSVYLGVDVAGAGCYSILSEDLLNPRRTPNIIRIINDYFAVRRNQSYLFREPEDAVTFICVLNELNLLSSGSIEDEDWHVLHVFKVLSPESTSM